MANLFPEGYENEVIVAEDLKSGTPTGYRNGIKFDFEAGDFVRDGMNRLVACDGIESWRAWCIKCLQTERYDHLAYSTDFGIETEAAMKSSSRAEAESILARQITEAILADPYERAAYIEDITFDWSAPDTVAASIIIHGIDDVSIDIIAYINRGEG